MGKPTKAQKAALLAVCREIADYVTSIGGTVLATRDDGTTDATVPTAVGSLALTIFPDGWIAGHFSDDRAVLLGLGDDLNRYSLKYNVQGTTLTAIADPQGFKRLALTHIDRAIKATLRDENIVLRVGPKTAQAIEALPILYEGSAAKWLSTPYDGPWQDAGVVKTLLTTHHPFCRQLDGDRWFVAQRSA